ncbi:hypothetical protein AVEN_144310-1, partial [Araneus ventricosus]
TDRWKGGVGYESRECVKTKRIIKGYAREKSLGTRGLVVRSRIRSQRVPGSKPDSINDPPPCMEPHTSNGLPLEWCGSLERDAPAPPPLPSSDCGSELRDPF